MIRHFLTITETPRTCWLTVAGWVTTAFFLSSLSADQIPETGLNLVNLDKLAHFLLYFGGGLVLARAFDVTYEWRWLRIFLLSSVLLTLYGMSDEFHQTFVSGRTGGDIGDLVADVAGAVVGTIVYLRIIRHAGKRTSRSPDSRAAQPD